MTMLAVETERIMLSADDWCKSQRQLIRYHSIM